MSIPGAASELVESAKTLAGFGTPQDTRQAERFAYVFQLHGPAWAGDFPLVFPLLLNPTRYSVDEPMSAEVTPTIGGVTAEEYGQILREVTITGTTGFAPKQGKFGALSDRPYSGLQQMKRLRDLFAQYGKLKADSSSAGFTRMTFHCLKDEDHWEIVPRSVRVDRDARGSGRFLYGYTISFTVVGLAVEFTPTEKPSALGIEEGYKNARKKVNEIAGEINDVIGAATQLQNEVRMTLNNNIFTDVIDGLDQIMVGVSDFLDGTAAVIQVPRQLANRVLDLLEATRTAMDSAVGVEESVRSYEDARDLTNRADRLVNELSAFHRKSRGAPVREAPEQTERNLRERQLKHEARTARALSSTASSTAPNPPAVTEDSESAARARFDRLPPPTQYGARRAAIVLDGDDIFSFAARETGDSANWLLIVSANDLGPPYISASGAPGTVRYGDTLMVPIAASPGALSIVASEGPGEPGEAVLADLHGTDLLQGEDGDLVVDEEHGSTDVLTAAGISNYMQSIRRRLRTYRRTNAVFPNYGVPRGVGRPGTLEQIVRLQFDTEAAILEDPRTEAVVASKFTSSGDLVGISLDVRPRGVSGTRSIARLVR